MLGLVALGLSAKAVMSVEVVKQGPDVIGQVNTPKGTPMRKVSHLFTRAALVALSLLSVTGQDARADDRLWANCRTCHAVTAPDGTQLARGGRSGPNLYGLAGRALAGDTGYRLYSDALLAAAGTGRRWSEADFVAYLADPDQFLRTITDNPAAQSDMHVAMRQGGSALWGYLQGLSQ